MSYIQIIHVFDSVTFLSGQSQGQAKLFYSPLLKQEMSDTMLSVLGLHAASCVYKPNIQHCQKQPRRSEMGLYPIFWSMDMSI